MFNRRPLADAALAALIAILAGCGSTPARISPMLENAVDYNHQGQQFYQGKDYRNALAFYSKALQVDRSIENSEGIALNLFNLAQTYLALNQFDAAQASLDEVVNNAMGLFSSSHLAQASMQKSIVFTHQKQPGAAREWITKADAFCGASCPQKGLVLNVQARFALDEHQPDAAIDLANRALSIHKKEMLTPEIANSLRLMGEANLAKQLPDMAIPLLQEALQLDKDQGLPIKISVDLLLLGKANKNADGLSAAFFRRALAVSRAAGDSDGERRALLALEEVSPQISTMQSRHPENAVNR